MRIDRLSTVRGSGLLLKKPEPGSRERRRHAARPGAREGQGVQRWRFTARSRGLLSLVAHVRPPWLPIVVVAETVSKETGSDLLRRSHQGYCLGGRTPAQALREALAIHDELSSLTGGFIGAEGEEVPVAVAAR